MGVCDYVATVDWQQVIALVIVGCAVGLMLYGRLRRRKFSFERDTHCGCSTTNASASQSSIIFRARKGERPQILMKTK
jgi:hypothetical protein